MMISNTSDEWEIEIGRQLHDLRLRRNLTQQLLAEQAGVALNAVKNLENGRGTTLSTLVKVVRVLGRAEWLGTLAPQVSVSPLQMLKTKPVRQRAARSKWAKSV
jgi:transcriptional regulator with XRE-family HTH domain